MKTPENLKYSMTDEWVLVEGNIVTMGITDYAQDSLSDIVFIEMLVSEEDVLNQGDNCATLESVKAAADVHAPLSGKVIAINDELSDSPEKVNASPYEDAWMIKMELSNISELEGLMSAEAYAKYCDERGH